MAGELQRVVIWKSLALHGSDYCALWHTDEGWLLKGTVAGLLEDQRPMLATYEVHCDENWHTRRVQVERTIGTDVKTLSLSVDRKRVWHSAGRELYEVEGCEDVDLAMTPATNTLPIRRLNQKIGSTDRVVAAWVKLPDLDVEPLAQRYIRLTANTYRYESDTGFSTEIVVDDVGLVTAYPGGWERIGSQ